jgi:hypothetical protein
MSINTSNLVARPLFSRKMVACFCLLSLILLPTSKVFSAGTMEYYHYDSQGSLLDVYRKGSRHKLSQRWNAWGERTIVSPANLQGSFLPSKNIPVYLGYKGAKSVSDDSLVLFNSKKVYSPRLNRLVNPSGTGTPGDNHFVYANNNPLNEEYHQPKVNVAGPGWRTIAYMMEMAAAGTITIGICVVQPELCGAVLSEEEAALGYTASFTTGGLVLGSTTAVYGPSLAGVGITAGVPSCTIAFLHRSNNIAKGWCRGSISAIHTGARIALSYKFSGKLGSGALTWGRPTANQIAYGMSFTAINGSTSIASMALGDSWSSFSAGRKVGASTLAFGISAAQAATDMYSMRWLEGFSAFQKEVGEDIGDIEMTTFGNRHTFDRLNTLETIPEGMVGMVGNKARSRIGEVVTTIYFLDLAAAANRRQKVLTWKEMGCQILNTTLYQGTRVGVENYYGGATIGRVPAAGGSGLLSCGGDYDSFF